MDVQVLSRSAANEAALLRMLDTVALGATGAATSAASAPIVLDYRQLSAMAAFLLIDAEQLDALLAMLGGGNTTAGVGNQAAALLGQAQPGLVNLTYQADLGKAPMTAGINAEPAPMAQATLLGASATPATGSSSSSLLDTAVQRYQWAAPTDQTPGNPSIVTLRAAETTATTATPTAAAPQAPTRFAFATHLVSTLNEVDDTTPTATVARRADVAADHRGVNAKAFVVQVDDEPLRILVIDRDWSGSALPAAAGKAARLMERGLNEAIAKAFGNIGGRTDPPLRATVGARSEEVVIRYTVDPDRPEGRVRMGPIGDNPGYALFARPGQAAATDRPVAVLTGEAEHAAQQAPSGRRNVESEGPQIAPFHGAAGSATGAVSAPDADRIDADSGPVHVSTVATALGAFFRRDAIDQTPIAARVPTSLAAVLVVGGLVIARAPIAAIAATVAFGAAALWVGRHWRHVRAWVRWSSPLVTLRRLFVPMVERVAHSFTRVRQVWRSLRTAFSPVRAELAVLGLDGGATWSDIVTAFRTKVKQLHPDVAPGDTAAATELRQVLEAFAVLRARHGTSAAQAES